MQVLGDLIRLPDNGSSLPLPWWHRAPLGLLHKTSVFVAALQTHQRPVGDVVVSVLDPLRWENMLRLECWHPDQPGVIANLFDAVYPLNVALAEAVTVETGDMHHATMLCEVRGEGAASDFVIPIRGTLLRLGFTEIRIDHNFGRVPLPVRWHELAVVEHGWLHNLQLMQWIEKVYPEAMRGKVDLRCAVVSADTEKRLLRYVFPRRGARTIKIQHADEPGTLGYLARVLAACNLNVLSALVRRGGQPAGTAELLAVCEPSAETTASVDEAQVQQELARVPRHLRPKLTIADARPANDVVHMTDPGRLPGSRCSVFVSHRFLGGPRGPAILQTIRAVLRRHDVWPIEPPSELSGSVQAQVSSRMWMADAGVVVVTLTVDESPQRYLDLAHEFGYLQAQGKPTLLLVEGEQLRGVEGWSRQHGIHLERFAGDGGPFDPRRPGSIDVALSSWVGNLPAYLHPR